VRALKIELKRVGCDPGEVDGVWGDKAKAALGEFARVTKMTLPGDTSNAKALQSVAGQEGRICTEIPNVTAKPTQRVADQPTAKERSRQVQKGEAAQPTPKLKCGCRRAHRGDHYGSIYDQYSLYSCD
jgi:hypothetical protein